MKYLAHIAEDGKNQLLEEHLKNVAELCMIFADSFNSGSIAYYTGLYHDIGKYSVEFQKRLCDNGHKVDHSTAGAKKSMQDKNVYSAFAIAGHHSGLPEIGNQVDVESESTLSARLKRSIPDYSDFRNEIIDTKYEVPEFLISSEVNSSLVQSFFVRMLYSVADYLDTERFMTGEERRRVCTINELNERFEVYLDQWKRQESEINICRTQILNSCIQNGKSYNKGIFTLSVPTGGGKTLSSLAFALNHAVTNGMDRIIYVIPYTSIIEQTAAIFSEVLGKENVLEHHSSVEFEEDEFSEAYMLKATENWDMPVIVTTSVQFFESIYAYKSSKCRKNHNIANSVIIFDEAQMIPMPYLRPCVFAMVEMVNHYQSSIVLCTATQPALNDIIREYMPEAVIKELCPPEMIGNAVFRRNLIEYIGDISSENLVERIKKEKQVLCIVNSRAAAVDLFDKLGDEEGCFHLSTLMIPKQRLSVIKRIRERLKNNDVCRVISTSMIEAGVDVDFSTVYREQNGLDSVLQAAGRCNREGKRRVEDSKVYVFSSDYSVPQIFKLPISVGSKVMQQYSNISDNTAITNYFTELMFLKGEKAQDLKEIIELCSRFKYREVAEKFKLIDQSTKQVYIVTEESEPFIDMLRMGVRNREVYRNLQGYAVSVYERHFVELYNSGDIEILDGGEAILINMSIYSETTGLSLHTETGNAYFL